MKSLVFLVFLFCVKSQELCKYGLGNKLTQVMCTGSEPKQWKTYLEKNEKVEKLIFLNVSNDLNLNDLSLNHTKYIIISHSSITNVKFGYFPDLIFLTIYKNQNFPNLSRDFFVNATHINWLSLVSNHNQLAPDTLHLLQNLTWFHLQNQKFPNLTREFLQENHKLHELSIRNCNLQHIDQHIFTATPEMELLSLNFNKLTHFEPDTFANLKKLKILEMHHNRFLSFDLVQFHGLKALEVLGLPSGFLKFVSAESLVGVFPELRKFEMKKRDLIRGENKELVRKLRVMGVDIIGTPHDCHGLVPTCTRI